MADSTKLKLPFIAAAQSQKHATHNDALLILDVLINGSIINLFQNTPPNTPADSDCYVTGGTPTGVWAGKPYKFAAYQDGIWRFYNPKAGWIVFNQATSSLILFDGSNWISTLPTTLQNLALLGVNTSADAANKLAVASDNVLITHAGTSANVKVNKNAAANDASFTFQTNFSARALFGLLGDDNFTFKVSANGSTYKTALVLDRNTGAGSFFEHPKFSAYLNFGQNYTAGAWQDLLCNITRHNDQADLVIASNIPTFTAPHAGYYTFGASAVYETTGGAAPDAMSIAFAVNGTVFEDTVVIRGDAALVSAETSVNTTALLKLAAGDTVKPKIFFTTNNGRVLANRNSFWGHQVP